MLSAPPRPSRLHSLDFLRAFVMLVGIIFHVTEAAQDIRGPARSPTLDIFLFISRSWRMPIFFILSGFFTELLVHRNGALATLKNRGRRIGVPFLLALVIVLPLDWFFHLAYEELAQSQISSPWNFDFFLGVIHHRLRKPRLHHLWFLSYLIGLSFLWIVPNFTETARRWRERKTPVIAIAALALFTACLWLKLEPAYKGRTDSLIYQPVEFFFYFAFFVLGGLSYDFFRRHGSLPSGSLWISTPLLALTGAALIFFRENHALRTGLQGSFIIAGCATVISVFHRFLNRERGTVRFLVAASYWTYLVHEPLLYFLGVIFRSYAWPLPLEISVNSTLVYLICFVSFTWLVRGTWLERLLNGATGSRPRR